MSAGFFQSQLRGPLSSRGTVALRPGFGRARSRGSDLSQRRAVLRGVLRDVAAGSGGGLARSHGASRRTRPPCASAPSFRSSATRCSWFRRAACGRRPESAKIRYKGAHFVPLSVIESLLTDKAIDEERWAVDGESECLVPANQGRGPFRVALRSSAGVDRLSHAGVEAALHRVPGIYARRPGSGPSFSSRRGCRRAMASSRCEARCCCWPIPASAASARAVGAARKRPSGSPGACRSAEFARRTAGSRASGCLSLYTPAENDAVDWKRGNYATLSRARPHRKQPRVGRAQSRPPMIAEGSVLLASNELRGAASNVAPEGFPHPVYRAGFAVTVPIPWRAAA